MSVDNNAANAAASTDERRAHHNLREIFEEVCEATGACFASTLGPGGSSMSLSARRLMHELHPELSQQEVAILFSAVERFHRQRAKS